MPPRRPSYSPIRQRREAAEKNRAASTRPAAGNGQPGATTPVVLVVVAEPRPKRTITTPKATGRTDDDGAFQEERAPPRGPKYSPALSTPYKRKMKRQPIVFCRVVSCIHILVLIIAVGLAMIVVYRAYHPKSPRLFVTSATLNAGHIDKFHGGRGLLNVNLTVLAAISNPNTKISIVLRYVQLNLYFEGIMIGARAVWPAPVQEAPGGSVLRGVHLVASNVTMTPEAVFVWQNATAMGGRGPVVMQLAGRFHTQLNFGRWFRCRYWASPQCTLWFDSPPRGALRRSQC